MMTEAEKARHAVHMKNWRNRNPQISTCVPFKTYHALVRLAEAQGVPLATLIRGALDDLITTAPALPPAAPAVDPEALMASIGPGLSAADRAVLRAPAAVPAVPAVPPVQHFYHPESDCYVSIPTADIEAFRDSPDGALCAEVDRLPPGLEKEGILPNCYALAPKKEDVKSATKWSYKDYLSKKVK